MTKKEKREQREEFFNKYLPLLKKMYKVTLLPTGSSISKASGIKININGKILDYYPGAGKVHKLPVNIVGKYPYKKENWRTIGPESFYKMCLEKHNKKVNKPLCNDDGSVDEDVFFNAKPGPEGFVQMFGEP